MPDHKHVTNLVWNIAGVLRGPYRLPQYERVMWPMIGYFEVGAAA